MHSHLWLVGAVGRGHATQLPQHLLKAFAYKFSKLSEKQIVLVFQFG